MWSGDLFIVMHLLHVDGHDGMTHVYGFTQLVAAALQWDKILDSFANHSYTKHRSIAFRSLLFYSQMDIADKCLWSTIR